MKKYLPAFLILAAVSCSKPEAPQPSETTTTTASEPQTPAPAASPTAEGLTLIESSDCLTCHKVDGQLVGPSYQEIANKYTAADTDKLAQKIIDGGSGDWGSVAMSPHSTLSKENAKKMVAYILSLKKN